jgi:hypothetical protein
MASALAQSAHIGRRIPGRVFAPGASHPVQSSQSIPRGVSERTQVVLGVDLDGFAAAHADGAMVIDVQMAVAGLPLAHRAPAGAAA